MAEDYEFQVSAATLDGSSVMDEHGNLNVAFLQINMKTFQISFNWLPSLFRKPMPQVLREAIALRLRIHADRLESGELERAMQDYLDINDEVKASTSE
jgi:hypothetical protein